MKQFFVTGTDTGVGKTYVTRWLVKQWRRQGHEAVGLKPIATGDLQDAEALFRANGGTVPLLEINHYFFKAPAAPLVSAEAEGKSIDPKHLVGRITEQLDRFRSKEILTLVEGVGGWRVPLAPGYEVRDWARDLRLPVIVVALNRLGMINHTLLTVESIQAQGLVCAGVIINDGPNEAPLVSPETLAVESNAVTLRHLLPDVLPIFQLNRAAEIAGEIPLWLRGK